MIINVDKEGKDFLLQVVDVVLKSKGLEALNLASILVTKTKYLQELDVPEGLKSPPSPVQPKGKEVEFKASIEEKAKKD